MDFKLLDELINGVGTLPQGGKLLSCCHLLIQIHEHKVNLGFELVHHHWHPRGLRTCWILCITHVLVALPFMYDRMNSIRLVSSGNSDPHRCMYRLHSALKQSRSSCRPVNRVGAAIFGSIVVVGGGSRSTGGDGDQALSWFCSTWICCVSSATCSSSVAMVVGEWE